MTFEPVRQITEKPEDADLWGWRGPGWYFFDPETRVQIEGPYATEELARQEYNDYCEAMTL